MNVTVVGAGYVGLVTGACLAEVGNTVCCVDSNLHKIKQLRRGIIPVYEPGLGAMVNRGTESGRLFFSNDLTEGISFSDVIMIAVGTPQSEDGSADLRYVLEVALSIGECIEGFKVIVNKSTVPVGTADHVRSMISTALQKRNESVEFSVVSNPEFLKEGDAVEDFQKPDRIVLGVENTRAASIMRELYTPFNRNHDRMIFMDVRSAELTKYAGNAMLATKISLMNEIANLAERFGADVESVRLGIGSDPRIGYQFIYPGCGYGGSCFPKDIEALIHAGKEAGYPLHILKAVKEVNDEQKKLLVAKVHQTFGIDLSGKHFAVWGLAFKPNTDDMRDAPSVTIIDGLIRCGATVCAFDPVANAVAEQLFVKQNRCTIAEDAYAALDNADALLVVTEWKNFRSPDFDAIRNRMRGNVIFDGRNIYDPQAVRAHGLKWRGIGRPLKEELPTDTGTA
jgi:UDPglucose 6-dehydrogenase